MQHMNILVLIRTVFIWDCLICASAADSEFCNWVQIGIDLYISYRKYQVKPHSSPWFSFAFMLLPQFIEITFFVCTNRINLLNLKYSLDRLVIIAKGFLKLPILAYKTKESITSQKIGSWDFWQIAESVLNKGKSTIPSLFNGPEVVYSASDTAVFAKNFSKNSNLDNLGIPCRTNLKLHNIYVTPKMVIKVITNLDSSKASSPDCIPVVVLKYCEPELPHILAQCIYVWKSLVFQIVGRPHWWSLYSVKGWLKVYC